MDSSKDFCLAVLKNIKDNMLPQTADKEQTALDRIIECVKNNMLDSDKLSENDDIWYVDDDEPSEIEHGKVFDVCYKGNELDSFSVTFDDNDFDEFYGDALGLNYFRTEKEAQAAQKRFTENKC